MMEVKFLIDGLNEACNNISASYMKVGDESMSAIRFWTTAKGNLPHLSYIFRKPEQLGTYFKTVTCYVTTDLLLIEVQMGKERTNNSKYHLNKGATEACTKRMTESAKGVGWRDIIGATKDFFIFYSYFSSKKLSEAKMDVVADLIFMVKTNKKDSTRIQFIILQII